MLIRIFCFSRNISIYIIPAHWLSGRVFTNGPVDWGSISGRVIRKTQKWYLIPPCLNLNIIRYISKVKRSN